MGLQILLINYSWLYPTVYLTRQVVGCSAFSVRLISIRALYVGFVRYSTSASGISNCTSLSTVMDSSFSTFEISNFALFCTSWATCYSEFMGVVLLPPLLMTHTTNFSSISLARSLVFIPPPRFFEDPSCGCLFSSKKGSDQVPLGSSFLQAHGVAMYSKTFPWNYGCARFSTALSSVSRVCCSAMTVSSVHTSACDMTIYVSKES